MHLLDVENLCHGVVTDRSVATMWRSYEGLAKVAEDDHLIAGTGPRAALTAWYSLPARCRRVIGRGLDGGERAILGSCDAGWLARRFDRVVIGSGDGKFATLARELHLLGVVVEVRCDPFTRSRKLDRWAARTGARNRRIEIGATA